jgi:Tfp pilus assembly protein PilO
MLLLQKIPGADMKRRIDFQSQLNMQTALIFLAAFLFLGLLIYPKGKEIYQNKWNYEQQRLKLENAHAAISGLPALTKDLFKIKRLLQQQSGLLLQPNEMGTILLLTDQSLEGRPSLKLLSVTPHSNMISEPLTLAPKIHFSFFPVTIELLGSYQDISLFIQRLFSQNKLVLLNTVTMEKQSEDRNRLHFEIQVYFLLNTLKETGVPDVGSK